MAPNLSPSPSLKTEQLLFALLLSMNVTAAANPDLAVMPWTGPSVSDIWIQSLLYLSLACSLFAALGAVFGKQWLVSYMSNSGGAGVEERGMDRQQKYDGLQKWHFHMVLEALPVLLQMSLFLFGISLAAFLYGLQRVIGIILIVPIVIGALFYFMTIAAPLIYDDSPFRTSLTDTLTMLLQRLFSSVPKTLSKSSPSTDSSPVSNAPLTPSSPSESSLDIDHKTAVALAWLVETSNDPIVLLDAVRAMPTVDWPRDAIERLPLHLLDRLLLCILTCLQEDVTEDTPISRLHRDRLLVYGAAFAFVFGEQLALAEDKLKEWMKGVSRRKDTGALKKLFLRLRAPRTDLPNQLLSLGSEEGAKYATLTSVTQILWYMDNYNHYSPDERSLPITMCYTTSFTMESLRARTTLYVARCLGGCPEEHISSSAMAFMSLDNSLLNTILDNLGLDQSEEIHHVYALAFATIMGYRSNAEVSINFRDEGTRDESVLFFLFSNNTNQGVCIQHILVHWSGSRLRIASFG